MNYRLIAHFLALVLAIVAVFLFPPLVIAAFRHEFNCVAAFAATIVITGLIALALYRRKPRRTNMYAREGFVLVSLAWIVVSLCGALPFYLSGEIPFYIDALFETISGFTTTGATILGNVEALSYSLLYWRSFTHWLGGMGVLVFLLAIVPLASGSGETLFIMRAESPGPSVSKLVSRTRDSARILYMIYIALTLLQTVLLLCGGMSVFEAVTTAFGTAGTGGFGVRNDSMASYSPYIQWVVTIFMALFGVNFTIYYLLILRMFRKAVSNEELRFYLGVILFATAVCTVSTLPLFGGNVSESLRHSMFQVVSIMTTTGFATTDFNLWPEVCRMLLVMLMIIGASAGSTGGGVKCSRVMILLKSLKNELRRLLHPNMVSSVRMDDEHVSKDTVTGVYAFFGAYALIAMASMVLLSIGGTSFTTNVTAVLACINNIGPGLDMVGPMGNFAGFSTFSKLVLSMDMLIGRLEIFPLLILFMPKVWKRARA